MLTSAADRAAAPFVEALAVCTDHLNDLEIYDVCARGGESELNDLLRHAVNRLTRPSGGIVQREQSRRGIVSRTDLLLSDMGSGMVFAAIEAKMVYSTDVLDAPGLWRPTFERDVAKLAGLTAPTDPRAFLLTWVPHFVRVNRRLRYMRGHVPLEGSWLVRHTVDQVRDAMQSALSELGLGTRRVTVRHANSEDGELVLDAYLTKLND